MLGLSTDGLSLPMLTHINDLAQAARTLVKARAFTVVCVTSLGLGMGVVIAILLLTRFLLSTPPGVNDDGRKVGG